ncbi:MAG: hypothetical protein ACKVPX_15275 [Myxococcaceae bacterium]
MSRISLAIVSFAALLWASACTPTDPADFIGTWQYQAGSVVTTSCSGVPNDSDPLTGNVTITQGTASALNVTYGSCTARFDAGNNNSVNLVAGTGCFNNFGFTGTGTSVSGTYTLSGDGNTLTERQSASFNVLFVSCSINVEGTLMRVSL